MEANDEEKTKQAGIDQIATDLPVNNNHQQDEGANCLMDTNDDQQDDEENDLFTSCLMCNGKFAKYEDALTKLHREQCQRVAREENQEANIEKTIADHRQCFFCKINCKITFNDKITWSNFNAHVKTHFDRKGHDCDYCQRSFSKKTDLTTHLLTVHKIGKPRVPCEYCDKTFPEKHNLAQHKNKAHKMGKSFNCDICDKEFYSKQNYNNHLKSKRHKDRMN